MSGKVIYSYRKFEMETTLVFIDFECDECEEEQNGEMFYSRFPGLAYVVCGICESKTYFKIDYSKQDVCDQN
jgi:transcription elongation factor Elf1